MVMEVGRRLSMESMSLIPSLGHSNYPYHLNILTSLYLIPVFNFQETLREHKIFQDDQSVYKKEPLFMKMCNGGVYV